MRRVFGAASASTWKANFGDDPMPAAPVPQRSGKRLKQEQRPLLNKLETDFLRYLQALLPTAKILPQAKRYRLGNGLWYKPDFTAVLRDAIRPEHCWEVKGPIAWRGGFENLKMAATIYPEIEWWLVWKEDGQWQEQLILP